MAELNSDGDVVAFSMPVHDGAVCALERQIDRIDFVKLPSDIRADLLAVLHLHQLVDVEYNGDILIVRIRPGIARVVDRAAAASVLL